MSAHLDLKIEKDVPLPLLNPGHRPGMASTFRRMEAGDSVFIKGRRDLASVSAATRKVSKETGHSFTSRKVDDGVRVWRIA